VTKKHTPKDLFNLMSRWDIEAKEIPAYMLRQGPALTQERRRELLVQRRLLNRLNEELRDAMHEMTVTYRGVVNGKVIIEASTEEECWKAVGDKGTVEFTLSTHWALTDSAIEHEK
jgi:hypothetical protein